MLSLSLGERSGAGARDVNVFVLTAIAYADGSDTFAIHFERKAAANGCLVRVAGDGEAQRKKSVRLVGRSSRGRWAFAGWQRKQL